MAVPLLMLLVLLPPGRHFVANVQQYVLYKQPRSPFMYTCMSCHLQVSMCWQVTSTMCLAKAQEMTASTVGFPVVLVTYLKPA